MIDRTGNIGATVDIADLLEIEAHRARVLNDYRAAHGRPPDAATLAHLAALHQRRAIIRRTAALYGCLAARDVDTRDYMMVGDALQRFGLPPRQQSPTRLTLV